MSDKSVQTSIETVRKWHALAERRRRHFVDLYRSERWRRYYTEENFLALMREVIDSVDTWGKILERSQALREQPPTQH